MIQEPSLNEWLAEARSSAEADLCGMFLTHCGVVRATAKREVRGGEQGLGRIEAVDFSYDAEGLERAIEEAKTTYPGIHYVRVWLNEGRVEVGGALMYVLIGGDIRPNVISALERLVGKIKSELVVEREIFAGDEA